jgi:ABC-type branched-subunit amino acid transport system substrate-binding protein
MPLGGVSSIGPAPIAARENAYGTVNWHEGYEHPDAAAFTEAYKDEYGEAPTQGSMEAYNNVLHYSVAVEQAGTFHPPSVIRELEGFEWNAGVGDMMYRASDHQAKRPVYIAKGASEAHENETGNSLELAMTVDPDDAWYGEDEAPSSLCNLPEYGDE